MSPDLVAVCHHRWALRVLAELHARGGAKFVTLSSRVGASRDSLTRTLGALSAQGLVRHNPGYGHPLRPEYLLAESALGVARSCGRVVRAISRCPTATSFERKWALPVIAALSSGPARFSAIRRALPAVTPRALATTLKILATDALIDRVVADDYPPTVTYGLTRAARPLVSSVRGLAAALDAR